MSLNRSEQMVLDYVSSHPDERQYWMDKVRTTSRSSADDHEASRLLDVELWAYYLERAQVVEPFRSTVLREGKVRISMRSLAEYWCRMWGAQRPKKDRGKTYDGL